MPITKKFGDTRATEKRRTLTLRPKRDANLDVEEFLLSNPEAILGQWASAMDKIASKPKSTSRPTEHQRKFRDRLGKAIWANLISSSGKLHSVAPEQRKALHAKWMRRVHPYQDGTFKPKKPPSAKGRLYDRFAGEIGTAEADVRRIAIMISHHLLEQEFKKHSGVRNKGRATRRASSIAKNTLLSADVRRREASKNKRSFSGGCEWDRYTFKEYGNPGDPVKKIYEEALKLEKDDRRVTWRVAAQVLFEHYRRVFDGNTKVMTFKEAEKELPELLALHRAIERYYRELLKRHKKARPGHVAEFGRRDGKGGVETINRRRKISLLMPKSLDEIGAKLEFNQKNKDTMALIRRGRILHYQLGRASGTDNVAAILNDRAWDSALHDGYYWSTAGQIEIKRAESFVRVWRNFVAHGSRTLTDWLRPVVDEDEGEDDIAYTFSENKPENLHLLDERAKAMTPVLFGARAGVLGQDEELLETVRVIGSMFVEIRHNSFHFRGMDGFVDPLKGKAEEWDKEALARLRALYDEDSAASHKRLQADLRGAHVEFFIDPTRLQQIWSALRAKDDVAKDPCPAVPITLPRYTRVVKRNANAWGSRHEHLPSPVNKEDMKKPERHFHYITTKLLYTRGFRRWITKADAATINRWIDAACERAQKAVVNLTKDELAVAKMIGKIEVPEGADIRGFFDDLVRLTATEFRVQKGYDPDPAAAKKQAAFLENLNCDVMAQAFNTYLKEAGFSWLKDTARPENLQANAISDVSELEAIEVPRDEEDWEIALYGALHLVPVGEVAKLQHQLRRWSNQRGQGPISDELHARLESLFSQYLDSHDEKFEGGDVLCDSPYLLDLFGGNNADMVRDRILPKLGGRASAAQGKRIPLRQLREMLRFGNLRAIRPFCKNAPITWAMIQSLEKLEGGTKGKSPIDLAQSKRTKHHDLLCKKDPEGEGCVDTYIEALRTVVSHRRLSNHVNFVNHVRFNGLMMNIMGRLADVAGIWERDFYFCMLALIEEQGRVPSAVFQRRGIKALKRARILDAARNLEKEGAGRDVRAGLQSAFSVNSRMKKGIIGIRDAFAHFDPLLSKEGEDASTFEVTALLNQARDLLSYDRKMKNAVVPSINSIFERENIKVFWEMDAHKLCRPQVQSKTIKHLEKAKALTEERDAELKENLRDRLFLSMVADLLGGTVAPETEDVASHGEGKNNASSTVVDIGQR